MSTETKTYATIDGLRAALPDLPDDAVIRDGCGGVEHRGAVPRLLGVFAPYTVTYEAPDTPAPLDPKAVKVGDTVTVTRGKAVHTDEVSQVSHGHSTHLDTVNGRGTYIVDPANAYGWTLTDHQPAPEPVDTLAETIWEAADTDFIEPLSKIAADKMAEAIRAKFAVIDLAKVDVSAIREAVYDDARTVSEVVAATLKYIGIEAS